MTIIRTNLYTTWLALCCLIITSTIQAQDYIPYRKGDKWGYCDQAKKILIAPKYQEVGFFRSAYGSYVAKVKLDGKYGLIDSDDTVKLALAYEDVDFLRSFRKRSIKVKQAGKWYLRQPDMTLMKETGYDEIDDKHTYGWLRNDYIGLRVRQGNKYGFIDFLGNIIIPVKYKTFKYFELSLGIDKDAFFIIAKRKKLGVHSYYQNKNIIPFKYDQIKALRLSHDEFKVKRKGLYGVYSAAGKFKIPVKYHTIERKSWNGFYKVSINKKYGYLDSAGKEIVAPKYNSIKLRHDYLYQVDIGKKYGILDSAGKQILPPKYDYIQTWDKKIFEVGINNKYGWVDRQNKILLPIKYDGIMQQHKDSVWVRIGNKHLIVHRNGGKVLKELATPVVMPRPFVPKKDNSKKKTTPKQLLPYQKNGKWGFAKGKQVVITCQYDEVKKFEDGLAWVKYKGKWGYIGKDGTEYFDN